MFCQTLDRGWQTNGADRDLARADAEPLRIFRNFEGGEYAICGSLSPELAKRIDQITMEVHQIPGKDPSELKRSLTGAGFRFRAQDKLYSFDRRMS